MDLDQNIVKLSLDAKCILHNPLINKGTAFTEEERAALGLHGLLPPHVSSIEQQVKRRYKNFCDQEMELGKYVLLAALHDRNETLFYRLVHDHIEEMLPYIYTPTVGEASVQFSYLYSQTRGIYFSYPMRDKMEEMINNIPLNDIDVIVVTDGSRILGLGDLGVGGMAIPIGKLALYTLFGGIPPHRTLPVFLDVGTNNEKLLKDPLYLGWRANRVNGEEYESFVDQFVTLIKKRYPQVLLQWEDFARPHAWNLLQRYKDQMCTFNDDIQGTASVTLAGILAAIKAAGSTLKDQRIVIFGAGSAGVGIGHLLVDAMIDHGMSKEEALDKIYLIDRPGLVHEGFETIADAQQIFSKPLSLIHSWNLSPKEPVTLLNVVEHVKPTILIGVSAQTAAFTEEVIKKMAKFVEKPIIFPLSNPTSKSEAIPHQLMQWTKGQAIIATGSPFVPVSYSGKTYTISQCNNVYVFPGVGLGAIVVQSRRITEKMFLRAAEILSENAPILKESTEGLFPKLSYLREVVAKVAAGVAQMAMEENLADRPIKGNIFEEVKKYMWFPDYKTYTR